MTTINTWVLLLLITLTQCQQWYERNNPNFLAPDTIETAIKEPNTIKLIKFFTPWCRYCRVIKDYIDQFKVQHGTDQRFKIYDFNCDNYAPGFCARSFRVGSFPALLFFNENGQMIYRLGGLYPKMLIWETIQTYNRLGQAMTQKLKSQSANPQENNRQQTILPETNEGVPPKTPQEQQQQIKTPENPEKPSVGFQQSIDPQRQIKIESYQTMKKKDENIEVNDHSTWLKLLMYLSCFVVGGYYFKKIMVPKDDEIVELEEGPSKNYDIDEKLSQIVKKEEDEELEEVQDEDL